MRIHKVLVSITVLVVVATHAEVGRDDPVGKGGGSVLDSIAIITSKTKGGKGFGSGFFTVINGDKYLISNQHLFDSIESFEIRALDNELILPTSFEVCQSRDLVRMHITNNISTLSIQDSSPLISEQVVIYGNSDGGGVATEIKGKVLGVGPNLIEVSAEFVRGNSGCPILTSNSFVIGVATFATLHKDPKDWISEGTRFQKTRRYGVRITNAKWNDVAYEVFMKQSKMISDSEEAIITHGITYLAFRNCRQKPRFNYERDWDDDYIASYYKQVDVWEEELKYVFKAKPVASNFFSKKIYSMCDDHYSKALKDLTTITRGEMKLAHQGRHNMTKDSLKTIVTLEKYLKSERFVSKYLQDQADELIELCDYVLEMQPK